MSDLIKRLRIGSPPLAIMLEAADHIEAQNKRIAELENLVEVASAYSSNQWISVEDRLPENVTENNFSFVAVASRCEDTSMPAVYHNDNFATCDNRYDITDVEWWTPLPEPPKKELNRRNKRIAELEATIAGMSDLLRDTMALHRDPDDPFYNECDKPDEQCMWCVKAKELIGEEKDNE